MKTIYKLKMTVKELADFANMCRIVAEDLISEPSTILVAVIFAEMCLMASKKREATVKKANLKLTTSQAVAVFQTFNWYHFDDDLYEGMTYSIVGDLDKQNITNLNKER